MKPGEVWYSSMYGYGTVKKVYVSVFNDTTQAEILLDLKDEDGLERWTRVAWPTNTPAYGGWTFVRASNCQCGSASIGIKPYQAGHSWWCPLA